MERLTKHGKLGLAAEQAGMDRKTARRYRDLGAMPSAMQKPRSWRTREDPFAEHWPAMRAQLEEAPGLQALTLFEQLMAAHPERFHLGQLRTFQRRVREWRATAGPPRELFFPQAHRPGEAMQTDFTHMSSLGITIQGAPFPHLVCHPVLPYSNWEWVTICHSESLLALRRGVQAALFRLGRVPEYHQTDNSTAATHDLRTGLRGFNAEYLDLVRHFGMKARTIAIGKKEQNGDTESLHGALKRRIEQQLLLRASRDFDTVESYEQWLWQIVEKANGARCARTSVELAEMRPVSAARLCEYQEVRARVTPGATIRVKSKIYSVPARLSREWVAAHAYEDRIEVYFNRVHQITLERIRGARTHRIDYRHVIWSLVRKPGAFERYVYRDDLFPSATFQQAYEVLKGRLESSRKADLEYLRILHFAAATMEADVEVALRRLLDAGTLRSAADVKAMVAPPDLGVPQIELPALDLGAYDALLGEEVAR
ncbi:MAG: IS21 family transposase [Dehalococcoidia bacterium]|nr:IS21 family transposase [Dehalococcoidia bacterium]